MGTTLTGTTPQDTYDSLIKVTDNGPISGTLKALSDGLGNDSTLSLSTTAASIAGTLAVAGAATFDTTTLVVDATNDRVGVGTATPSQKLSVSGGNLLVNNGTTPDSNSGIRIVAPISTTHYNWMIAAQQNISGGFELTPSTAVGGTTFSTPALSILGASGNVGIGTSAPEAKLHVAGSASGSDVTLYIDNAAASTLNSSSRLKFSSDLGSTVSNGGAELNCINVDAGNGAVDLVIKSYTGSAYTEKARFLAGGGITFNGDTLQVNALDDYEEGTWTATLTDGTTTKTASCSYTKIGRMVYLAGGVSNVEDPSAFTGDVYITGVPFVPAFSVSLYGFNNYLSTASVFTPYLESNQQIRFYKVGAASADNAQMQGSDLDFYSDIYFAGQFTV